MSSAREPQDTSRIYALRHPETRLTRFIEETLYLLPEKLHRILASAKYGDSSLRGRWVRALQSQGLEPLIVLLQEGTSKNDLIRWKKEYADELLENVSRKKPKHDNSGSERTG